MGEEAVSAYIFFLSRLQTWSPAHVREMARIVLPRAMKAHEGGPAFAALAALGGLSTNVHASSTFALSSNANIHSRDASFPCRTTATPSNGCFSGSALS
jgi:hypothetical protein